MAFQNILLIDDDEDDTEYFLAAAKEISHSLNFITLQDATEALRKLMSKEILPEIIFLDLNMPKMNGQQFLKEIKNNKTLKHIPVIIFSTTAHKTTIQATKDLGANDFITKPVNFDELVNLLGPFLK